MVNQSYGETYRRWKVILEVERFIEDNDDGRFGTRKNHWRNYFCQLLRLWNAKQLIIQRNDISDIVGVCGWVKVTKETESHVNKITWALPKDISVGQTIYVNFCVLNGGDIKEIKDELKNKGAIEAFWYNVGHNKYTRVRKHNLKESTNGNT